MDRVKVAIASRQVSGVTGTTTTILEHARRLSALGWDVHVYGDDLDVRRIRQNGGTPHRLPRLPFGGFFKRRFFAWLFEKAVAGRGYDLICGHGDTLVQDVLSLHNCVHAAYEAVRAAPLPKSSGVGRLHERILREGRFAALIANSRLMKAEVVARFGLAPEKVTVIWPGYDPLRFRTAERAALREPLRRELGIGEKEVLVGLITSGDFAKRGVSAFLEALARLSPGAKKATRALVIGSESRLGPYRSQAAQAGLAVRFLPPLERVERYYHALDVYVHPALYEEFGQSVQEAMACGAAVLTSARVGASELFSGAARELLLQTPAPAALAARLEALVGDASLRGRYAAEGARACRGNTWDDNFRSTLACYETTLAIKR